MRTGVLFMLLLAHSVGLSLAGRLPLTVQEIGLMLRSGCSPAAVQIELGAKHLLAPPTATEEAALVRAGATAELIGAMKNGAYTIPAGEAAAAQSELASQALQRAKQAEESRKMDTLYRSQLARSRAATAGQAAVNHPVAAAVKGSLVTFKNGSFSPYDDEALPAKKLIALYFSAHWCAPCRKFTPQLVEWYNRVSAQHPEFEIVFMSNDRSQFAMETYMRETQMPWPAIDFTKLAGKSALSKLAGDGIPCLVLVDATGKVISDSYAGKQYLGPAKVVSDLDAIFAQQGRQVAQGH